MPQNGNILIKQFSHFQTETKLQSLFNSNNWKHIRKNDLIQKFSNIWLCTVDIKALRYIYTYCHPLTDCFVLSELFSVAKHAGRSKPGSKPVQFYVRLSFKLVGHQAEVPVV